MSKNKNFNIETLTQEVFISVLTIGKKYNFKFILFSDMEKTIYHVDSSNMDYYNIEAISLKDYKKAKLSTNNPLFISLPLKSFRNALRRYPIHMEQSKMKELGQYDILITIERKSIKVIKIHNLKVIPHNSNKIDISEIELSQS